jgi:poly(ribitol-phosphate) beta-N-acetylglucosaminyltransferase
MPAPSDTSGDRVKVSVVVPVYNPGRYIDDCIASMLRQSLPLDEYEAVFVDDGSTDGTGARLDALAAEHPHISAIHIPNSGWPGRPRNVGMDAARGKYVYFVDQDDWVADEALERMYDRAERNHADVVVGKVVGHGPGVSRRLFERNIDDAKPLETPLLELLTPHKLFRRSFLTDHEIRFAEGPRRLEDHLFVTTAFLAAKRISILADYSCYHWVHRDDHGNAGRRAAAPSGYYQNLREVLDVVDEHVSPGPLRDRFYAHWYQGKGLNHLRGPGWARRPSRGALERYAEIRRLALERFGPNVASTLPMTSRVRARLVVADRLDLIRELAAIEQGVRLELTGTQIEATGAALRIDVATRLMYADGSPIAVVGRHGRTYWRSPGPLVGDGTIREEDIDVTEELAATRIDVEIRNRTTEVVFTAPMTAAWVGTSPDGDGSLAFSAKGTVSPSAAAAGTPIGLGKWDVYVRVLSCGFEGVTALPGAPEQLRGVQPLRMPGPGADAVAYVTVTDRLALNVRPSMRVRPADREGAARLKVSVVVPVYNPGRYIDDCVASMLRQSLPFDEYEVIFVDDGSTDGTGDRLDALAAEYPHIAAIHIPNSGWPGRPRNVGTDAARGEFVLFVDNDDWLNDEAVERLYERAEANGADVVVGKEVGHGKGVSRRLFRTNVDDAWLLDAPLLELLTPHKLFRRAFLVSHGIRFPEGRRRLEDHVFVMKAFFAAGRISILADYPCYHWVERDDAGNATSQYSSPGDYYANVREVLDVVAAHTEPGPYRDALYAHWYRSKGLTRLRGRRWTTGRALWALRRYSQFRGTLRAAAPRFAAVVPTPGRAVEFAVSADRAYRRFGRASLLRRVRRRLWERNGVVYGLELYAEVRQLALERFGAGVARALPMRFRVMARAVTQARPDLISAQAVTEYGLHAVVALDAIDVGDGVARLSVRAHLAYAGGKAVSVRTRGARTYWVPPRAIAADPEVLEDDIDVTDEVGAPDIALVLRHRTSDVEHEVVLSEVCMVAGDGRAQPITYTGVATVDARISAAGQPLDRGTWDLSVYMHTCGWEVLRRLPVAPATLERPTRVANGELYATVLGNLSLKVGR